MKANPKLYKYSALMFVLLISIMPAWGKKKQDSGKPIIEFSEQTHDFGIISGKKDYVTTEFEFVNTGNGPLVILDAKAECGCTRPSYPKNPITPGKSGKIKINFIPKGYFGGFTKSIKIYTNAGSKPKVLKITGTVNPNN